MRKIKPAPKCKMCDAITSVHCRSVMLNGCDNHFCYLCWREHSLIHDEEWRYMTEAQKEALYNERI